MKPSFWTHHPDLDETIKGVPHPFRSVLQFITMDSSQPLVHPIDYPHSSGLSEADSLSDSDWLDISSSKESDDNDSVSSKASDHDEVDYGPRSRRSSTSLGSSRDGDVEAWEGFAEDARVDFICLC